MKKLLRLLLVLAGFAVVGLLRPAPAHAYTNSRMMDDQVFDNVNSMTEQQIRDFINSHPNTCLTRVGTNLGGGNIFPEPIDYFNYNGNHLVDAARVVYLSAQHWGLNPQVLLATMQKEQALITDGDCFDPQGFPTLHKALGQGCTEGGPCPSAAYDGFSQQLMRGAWQLKFNKERAYGNTNWDGDQGVKYYGYMTQGNRARCGIILNQCSGADTQLIHYDGFATLDGQSTYIENGATAALYSFTPHLNQSFPGIFQSWFGSTLIYDYQFVTASNPPSVMQPGQTVVVSITLRNTGGLTWGNESNQPGTPMRLYTTRPTDHNNPFGGGGGWIGQNRISMYSTSVAPGQNGTFSFEYTAPTAPGTYVEYFAPTAENVVKLADTGMGFAVTVPTVYSYQFVSGSNPPSTMTVGQTASASITIKNTGNVTWGNETNQPNTPARLYTTRPIDHNNPFGGGSGWVGQKRMTMQTASVAPGQNGTFSFDYTAPSTPGDYVEYFAPTIENVVKLGDIGMGFAIHVIPQYDYQFVSGSNPPSVMQAGQTVTVSITLRNTGGLTWGNETNQPNTPARLYTTRPIDHNNPFGGGSGWVGQKRMTMQTASVAPGQNGTFSFDYTAPSTPGDYVEYFAPTIENVVKLGDIGMGFAVKVQ